MEVHWGGGLKMFERISPESAGISSKEVLRLLKIFDKYKMRTHSIMMLKGNNLISEAYYKPFDKDFLHRMYSVSKSFVAIAVGVAITEGIMKEDDVICDYFPEFCDPDDELQRECTVRDMLSMQSNIGENIDWWGKFKGRVDAYYTLKTDKIPGTIYCYDSIGSFLLGCIIEKKTGKHFLEYLKEKVLLDMGFSEESYTMTEPGGFSIGDSGVMCTARDFALFARLVMQKGEFEGKQYIDRDFMERAISKQVHNDIYGGFNGYNTRGYGYLFWKTHDGGFSLLGAGGQFAICDMENDFLFVITANNQAAPAAHHILFNEILEHFIPKISKEPLPENPDAYQELLKYEDKTELICQYGSKESSISSEISGKTYLAKENSLGITSFCLDTDNCIFEFEMNGKQLKIEYALCENKLIDFSFGERAVLNMMGKNEEGTYKCASSGAWVDDNTFALLVQVIDTYFGEVNIHICYKDDRASVRFSRSGQYVFENMNGYIIGNRRN